MMDPIKTYEECIGANKYMIAKVDYGEYDGCCCIYPSFVYDDETHELTEIDKEAFPNRGCFRGIYPSRQGYGRETYNEYGCIVVANVNGFAQNGTWQDEYLNDAAYGKSDAYISYFHSDTNENVLTFRKLSDFPYLKSLCDAISPRNISECMPRPAANDKPLSDIEESIREKVLNSKNVILHGAPGTGKTYVANRIASSIVSNGMHSDRENLDEDTAQRIGFVQFHPSYDYTDFVEGLRPCGSEQQGDIDFKLKPGIFKTFCERAKEDPDNTYVFIIDEINRGEISKIFGELFFSVDPGYRGEKGCVATQYANMYEGEDDVEFFIPENVYLIGTMNDIDRSVDSFDFAMRRRFRFIEVNAKDTQNMLDEPLGDDALLAKEVMNGLNEVIANSDTFGSGYEIGASYFLKLKEDDLNGNYVELWNEFLEPLLSEYLRGAYEKKDFLRTLGEAYAHGVPALASADELAPWSERLLDNQE